ncbi:hypothetical protein Leryth_024116 [Lithospermum erythrorhizon]|nr:hypothetical protein Leryth_024116 [Lithospermum erythrorhizon]
MKLVLDFENQLIGAFGEPRAYGINFTTGYEVELLDNYFVFVLVSSTLMTFNHALEIAISCVLLTHYWCRNMSPSAEDDPMHVDDVQGKTPSDKDNAAPRSSAARHMSQSQPTKKTFTFALKPKSTPSFVYSMACNEGLKLVIDMSQSGLSFEQELERNIRKAVEKYEFDSFHGEIQFTETKQEDVLGLSAMPVPMTLEENITCPHARDNVVETHDLGSPDALDIPLLQISGSDFQTKGTSVSSCKGSVEAMATENVAEEIGGRVNAQKALT